MKIMTLSDLHHGKWGTWGMKAVQRAGKEARDHQIDVLLLGGDLAEPSPENQYRGEVLSKIMQLPIPHKLWVIGNNDLEDLRGPISQYAQEAHSLVSADGIQVLDYAPVTIDGVTFVGNLGWFDGSLWGMGSTPLIDPEGWAPISFQEAQSKTDAWTRHELGERMDLTSDELFELCQNTLHSHLREAGQNRIVVMTHTSPTPSMCMYGHNPKFDFLNYCMGWDDLSKKALRPPLSSWKPTLQLCGHTHRFKMVFAGENPPLVNVSGEGQPRIFEIR